MPTVYLAGPVTGEILHEAAYWRDMTTFQLNQAGIACIDPLRSLSDGVRYEDVIRSNFDTPLSTPAGILTTSRFDVQRADVVLVNLLGAERVSIGTCMEIAWADLLRKPVVLVIDADNPHRHPMIEQAAGYIVETLDAGVAVVRRLLVG